jgi:hypothetical protein
MWRLVDARIDAKHLPGIRAARAHAREKAWAAGAAPAPGEWLHLDIDATITIDHSDNKEQAGATWKKTWGHHWLLAFLDRSEIAGGEALAGLLRPGNAGSNTAADHVQVLQWALESLPAAYRPTPDDRGGPQVLARCDSAGATHTFADACRAVGVGTRLILRKERLHPRAQLRFTDSDGLRVTAFITDTPTGVVPRQLAGLELRHRQHARVEEDRIREAKATACATCPVTGPRRMPPGWKSSWPQPIWWPGRN